MGVIYDNHQGHTYHSDLEELLRGVEDSISDMYDSVDGDDDTHVLQSVYARGVMNEDYKTLLLRMTAAVERLDRVRHKVLRRTSELEMDRPATAGEAIVPVMRAIHAFRTGADWTAEAP